MKSNITIKVGEIQFDDVLLKGIELNFSADSTVKEMRFLWEKYPMYLKELKNFFDSCVK
jgi:hypothetical protein